MACSYPGSLEAGAGSHAVLEAEEGGLLLCYTQLLRAHFLEEECVNVSYAGIWAIWESHTGESLGKPF